jgi:hypothetical protein
VPHSARNLFQDFVETCKWQKNAKITIFCDFGIAPSHSSRSLVYSVETCKLPRHAKKTQFVYLEFAVSAQIFEILWQHSFLIECMCKGSILEHFWHSTRWWKHVSWFFLVPPQRFCRICHMWRSGFFFLWLGSRFNAIVFSVMTENVWGFRLQESHICIVRFSLVVTLVKAIYNQKQQKMLWWPFTSFKMCVQSVLTPWNDKTSCITTVTAPLLPMPVYVRTVGRKQTKLKGNTILHC